MSKAILEVDMPRSCYECELIGTFYDDEHEEYFESCGISLTRINSDIGKLINCPLKAAQKGEWIDCSEEGYVECPFCHHLTNCDDNIKELHYCWNCGAELDVDMRGEEKCGNHR